MHLILLIVVYTDKRSHILLFQYKFENVYPRYKFESVYPRESARDLRITSVTETNICIYCVY